ncbi:MAG: hypothetical protein WC386_01265 [Candidatus Paceibacterota bacterium]|jgi:virulence-associated protein VapD
MTDKINFEISDSCSSGLMQSLQARRWHDQKSFSLEIEKGTLFTFLETLIPDMECLLHIGCSADIRPPSFEYTLKHGDIRKKILTFSYKRTLQPRVFFEKDLLHDCNGLRDLESVARELSNLQNCTEEITLFCSGKKDGTLSQNFGLEIIFKSNRALIIGLRDIPKIEEVLGGSITIGKSKSNDREAICDLAKEMYLLYQHAAPEFGERRPVRKKLEMPT